MNEKILKEFRLNKNFNSGLNNEPEQIIAFVRHTYTKGLYDNEPGIFYNSKNSGINLKFKLNHLCSQLINGEISRGIFFKKFLDLYVEAIQVKTEKTKKEKAFFDKLEESNITTKLNYIHGSSLFDNLHKELDKFHKRHILLNSKKINSLEYKNTLISFYFLKPRMATVLAKLMYNNVLCDYPEERCTEELILSIMGMK